MLWTRVSSTPYMWYAKGGPNSELLMGFGRRMIRAPVHVHHVVADKAIVNVGRKSPFGCFDQIASPAVA